MCYVRAIMDPDHLRKIAVWFLLTILASSANFAGGVLRIVGPSAVVEKDGHGVFTVIADPPARDSLVAEVRVRGTTATDGSDFHASSSIVSTAGINNGLVAVQLVTDGATEPAEEIVLDFVRVGTGAGDYTFAPPLTVRLLDDESIGMPAVEIVGARLLYEDGPPATFEAKLTQPAPAPLSVRWRLVGRTAAEGTDFIAGSGTLNFEAGQNSANFQVLAAGDSIQEGTEELDIELFDPSSGLFIADPLSKVAIEDDDRGYGISSYSSPWADEPSETATLLIDRIGTFPFPTTVQARIEPVTGDPWGNGSSPAVAGVDYVDQIYTVTFAAGETRAELPIRLLNDELEDGLRQIRVVLINPSDGLQLIPGLDSYIVMIRDNELGYTLYPSNDPWNNATGNLYEGAGAYATLFRLGDYASPSEVTVRFSELITAQGSPGAEAGIDFTPGTVTVRFGQGEKTARVPLPLIDDALFEPVELLGLSFSQWVWSAGSTVETLVQILDNEFNPLPVYPLRPFGLTAWSFVSAGPGKAFALLLRNEDSNFTSTIVRLNADGAIDPTFTPQSYEGYQRFLAGADGTVFLMDTPDNRLTRFRLLRPDGSVDPNFAPYESSVQRGVAAGPGGTLFIGEQGDPSHLVRIVKLGPDGLPDPTFAAPQINGPVSHLAATSDGGVFIAGAFWLTVEGRESALIKIRADGNFDSSVGSQTIFNGIILLRDRLYAQVGLEWIRLLDNGTRDTSFSPIPGTIFRPVLQDEEGRFYQYGFDSDFPTQYVRRYLPNGVLDPSYLPGTLAFYEEFNPGVGATAALIVGDSLFISGEFIKVNGTLITWDEINSARVDLNPAFPRFTLDPERTPLLEHAQGATTFRVLRAGPNFTSPITVGYRTRSGSATVGEDLPAQEGQLVFPAGVSQLDIQLSATNDSFAENDETFSVDFFLPDGTPGGSSEVTLESEEIGLRILFDPARNQTWIVGIGLGRAEAALMTSVDLVNWTFVGNPSRETPFQIYPRPEDPVRFYKLQR